jgi:hypothetical protein
VFSLCIFSAVLTNKNGGVTVTQNVLLINSQYVLAQIDHHQVILEKCTNGDE